MGDLKLAASSGLSATVRSVAKTAVADLALLGVLVGTVRREFAPQGAREGRRTAVPVWPVPCAGGPCIGLSRAAIVDLYVTLPALKRRAFPADTPPAKRFPLAPALHHEHAIPPLNFKLGRLLRTYLLSVWTSSPVSWPPSGGARERLCVASAHGAALRGGHRPRLPR